MDPAEIVVGNVQGDRRRSRRLLAGGVLCQRGQADRRRACPDEGPNGRGRAGIECKEMRVPVSGPAAPGHVTAPSTRGRRLQLAANSGN